MAIGLLDFLKRLFGKLFGAKPAAKTNPRGGRSGQRQNRGGRGRGERGGEARRNPQQDKNSAAPRRDARGANSNGRSRSGERGAVREGGEARGEKSARRGGERPAREPRESRGGRRDGARDSRRSGRPASVNTAANMMRPGGVVPPEELEARRAAHAAWKPEDFNVPEKEGKKRFHDFDLPSEVMHAIADLGFQYCTQIQQLSLEHALAGKNIAGKAQTGSGKTAAFLVAILTRYLRTPESRAKVGGTPRALVIAPTRELVIQICKDADAIGKYCGLRSLAVYGGMDFDRQREELLDAPVDLLVATPGRLLDFCQRRVVNLKSVDTLVIDEADRMLDMGFIPDVSRVMGHLPPKDKRATMLYSATLNDDVMRLAMRWMEEPVRAEVESTHNATDTVRQVVYVVRSDDKFKVLFNHIALHPEARAIVFCNRKSTTEDVHTSLARRGVKCEMLSGDVNQNRRLQVLENFRAGKTKIVVATDVAGRGIHVDDIDYVINFDFPYEAEDYVHRIGRTGRAGNTGIAISFADEDESFAIPEIEEYIKEPLKCTIIQDDDPLLKPLEKLARGQRVELAAPDAEARAAVDAREAVTAEQLAAAAALVGGEETTGKVTLPAEPTVEPAPAPEPAAAPEPAPVAETPAAEPEAPAEPEPDPTQEDIAKARLADGVGVATKSNAGKVGFVNVPEGMPPRPLPTFDNAFVQKKDRDELNVYVLADSSHKSEEWNPPELPKPVVSVDGDAPESAAEKPEN